MNIDIEGLLFAVLFWIFLAIGYELVTLVAEAGSWVKFIN